MELHRRGRNQRIPAGIHDLDAQPMLAPVEVFKMEPRLCSVRRKHRTVERNPYSVVPSDVKRRRQLDLHRDGAVVIEDCRCARRAKHAV